MTADARLLRQDALDALGMHGDERARDVLSHAELQVIEAVTAWESSAGRLLGVRVVLALDARRLGVVRGVPRVADELHAALSVAVARRPRLSMSELVFGWSRAPGARPLGYRDAPPPSTSLSLGEALVEYAEGSGDAELAALLARAEVEQTGAGGREVRIGVAPSDAIACRSPHARAFFTRAVRDLLADDRVGTTPRPLLTVLPPPR